MARIACGILTDAELQLRRRHSVVVRLDELGPTPAPEAADAVADFDGVAQLSESHETPAHEAAGH